tara:strand:- start:6 stop:464 length:459 start_codon:yes stop_codon:yes gene_type:complete
MAIVILWNGINIIKNTFVGVKVIFIERSVGTSQNYQNHLGRGLRHRIYLLLLLFISCTNAPNGAIDFSTTAYYIDGKFHEDIPEEYIFKTWGYRITDAFGKEHTYRTEVFLSHNRTITKWCTIHRVPEDLKAVYNGKEYWYWVSINKRMNRR